VCCDVMCVCMCAVKIPVGGMHRICKVIETKGLEAYRFVFVCVYIYTHTHTYI
jgi:hypothetical protein